MVCVVVFCCVALRLLAAVMVLLVGCCVLQMLCFVVDGGYGVISGWVVLVARISLFAWLLAVHLWVGCLFILVWYW